MTRVFSEKPKVSSMRRNKHYVNLGRSRGGSRDFGPPPRFRDGPRLGLLNTHGNLTRPPVFPILSSPNQQEAIVAMNLSGDTNRELSEKLRTRSRFMPIGDLDRVLMVEAADRIGESAGMDTSGVLRWLSEHDVHLVGWQKKRLGIGD